jgi:hypothetical protein
MGNIGSHVDITSWRTGHQPIVKRRELDGRIWCEGLFTPAFVLRPARDAGADQPAFIRRVVRQDVRWVHLSPERTDHVHVVPLYRSAQRRLWIKVHN